MSRGRPRHQASRRRTYSARMRELRDRRAQIETEEPAWTDEAIAIEIEIEEHLDFEAPTSWANRLDDRPSAA
jgi:hypothetical protein